MNEFTVSISLFIAPAYLWSMYGIALVVWGVISGILVYHWRSYTFYPNNVSRMKKYASIYFVVSVVLCVGMLVSLLLYTL